MLKKWISLAGAALLAPSFLIGGIQGRVDVGVAYVHLDVIKGNNTEKKMDMPAVKADATVLLYQGWCLKPSILYADKDGHFSTASIGAGRCLPLNDRLVLTPSVGVSYTDMQTDLKDFVEPLASVFHFDAEFESTSVYISLDASYKICECWRTVVTGQYAWARSHSKYKDKSGLLPVTRDKGNSSGPVIAGMIEYDINDCWSANLGAAYNNSLSEEKDGLRGFGVKIGIARWF